MEKSGTEFLGVIINCIKKNERKLVGYSYNSDYVYANYANSKNDEIQEDNKDSIIKKLKSYITKIIKWIED